MRWLPGLIVSAAAVLFMRKFISLDDLLQAFKAFTLADIAIIIRIGYCFHLSPARWDGRTCWRMSVSRTRFLIVNEGYLFNNLIPRSGEIVRTLLVSGVTRISAFQVASSVLVERACGCGHRGHDVPVDLAAGSGDDLDQAHCLGAIYRFSGCHHPAGDPGPQIGSREKMAGRLEYQIGFCER